MRVSRIGVCGAGARGAGIAQVALAKGLDTWLYDPHSEALEQGRAAIGAGLARWREKGIIQTEGTLTLSPSLTDLAACDVVVEAIVEDLKAKQDLFRLLDKACPQALLASNTSSLSITAIAGATSAPERVVGLHFFSPVPAKPLVEVVAGLKTEPGRLLQAMDLVRALGKEPVVAKDSPGFIVNRIACPFYGEALRLLGEGAADVKTIDRIVRGAGFQLGPFQLMDLIGIDVNLQVTRSLYDASFGEPRFRPHPIQRQMVEAGLLGKQAGEGFYVY